jgi:hypothetical protein
MPADGIELNSIGGFLFVGCAFTRFAFEAP